MNIQNVLAEEIAETAYQQVFDSASSGDFRAEIVVALRGEDEDSVATYSGVAQADTVETELGTAETNTRDQVVALSDLVGRRGQFDRGGPIERCCE